MSGDISNLRVLLVEDDPDYAALVQQWLQAAPDGLKFLLSWTDSIAGAVNRLAQGDINVVLLDLSLPDSEGINSFRAIREICPATPIIILSAARSESLALHAIGHGAEDYLVKSTCTGDLLNRAVCYAALRRKREGAEPAAVAAPAQNRVVTVLGAKGGVGATTVACALAAELQTEDKGPTLLADLDERSGLCAFVMGVEDRYTLRDAVQNLDRLDAAIWQSLIAQAGNIDVLPSPAPGQISELDPESVSRVLGFARRSYRWVILDPGRLDSALLGILRKNAAGDLLLVTTDSVWSLREAKRKIDALAAYGFDRDHLGVIVNQIQDGGDTMADRELAQLFGVAVYGRIPQDAEELRRAVLDKRLPAESSRFRRSVRNVARRLAGLEELRPRRAIPNLVSLLRLGRRAPEQDAREVVNQDTR